MRNRADANARAKKAHTMHKNCYSFAMIAKTLGVSTSRAQQLAIQGQTIIQRERTGDPIYELSTRTRNVLVACGCVLTPEGVAKRFAQFSPYQVSRIVNFGDVSKLELHLWLARHFGGGDDLAVEAKSRAQRITTARIEHAHWVKSARAKVAIALGRKP